jgi:hypothetical protein
MLADGQMRPPPFLPSTSQRRATAVATDEGRFVFRDVPAGTYWITATREGYAPGASGRRRIDGPAQQFAVAAGTRVTDANIVM